MLQILSRSKNASRVLWCVRCVVVVVTVIGAVGLVGCTRDYYRRTADKQTYGILEEKAVDERWQQESFDITPDPRSRFFDPHDPDNPPLPPDDPTANQSMVSAYGMRGSELWNQLDQLDQARRTNRRVRYRLGRFDRSYRLAPSATATARYVWPLLH